MDDVLHVISEDEINDYTNEKSLIQKELLDKSSELEKERVNKQTLQIERDKLLKHRSADEEFKINAKKASQKKAQQRIKLWKNVILFLAICSAIFFLVEAINSKEIRDWLGFSISFFVGILLPLLKWVGFNRLDYLKLFENHLYNSYLKDEMVKAVDR